MLFQFLIFPSFPMIRTRYNGEYNIRTSCFPCLIHVHCYPVCTSILLYFHIIACTWLKCTLTKSNLFILPAQHFSCLYQVCLTHKLFLLFLVSGLVFWLVDTFIYLFCIFGKFCYFLFLTSNNSCDFVNSSSESINERGWMNSALY